MDDSATETTGNWWRRLAGGLKKSSSALGSAIAHVVAKRQLDAATIDEIEDELVRADLGAETAGRIATELRLSPPARRCHQFPVVSVALSSMRRP